MPIDLEEVKLKTYNQKIILEGQFNSSNNIGPLEYSDMQTYIHFLDFLGSLKILIYSYKQAELPTPEYTYIPRMTSHLELTFTKYQTTLNILRWQIQELILR